MRALLHCVFIFFRQEQYREKELVKPKPYIHCVALPKYLTTHADNHKQSIIFLLILRISAITSIPYSPKHHESHC